MMYTCYMCVYVYTNGGFLFVFANRNDNGLSPVLHALPSEARHAWSEATRFVTANCTYNRLKPAHSTDYRPHIRQTQFPQNTS